VPENSWKSHPIHTTLLSSAPYGLTDYVNRIHELSDSEDPSSLLAHAYVRYLGDLSGGQTIRHTIAKAYGLDEASGQGLSFYAFKELKSSKPANQGEMKRIKDWYRAGMNTGAGDNKELKGAC
jgi:heme oxygenase (biliverdin-producing, ferredoxin)